MAVKIKPKASLLSPEKNLLNNAWSTPPATTEERLMRIQVLGKRIDGYIQYMCGVSTVRGVSTESKEKAVAVFYERLKLMEHDLNRIQEDLQLG
jgi:hypothetical protein